MNARDHHLAQRGRVAGGEWPGGSGHGVANQRAEDAAHGTGFGIDRVATIDIHEDQRGVGSRMFRDRGGGEIDDLLDHRPQQKRSGRRGGRFRRLAMGLAGT